MKKRILIILMLVLALNCFAIPAFAWEDTETIHGYASYTDTAPVIDGKTDAVWQTTQAVFTRENYTEGEAYAAFKILWDETHLYFYAKVYDETISCCGEESITNGINFWVSETNSNLETYLNLPGDWHVFCNQNAASGYYTGNASITEKSVRATEIHDGYYIVECAVPVQTEGLTFQNGHIIGFDVSVDDDFDGDNIRDDYSTWANLGSYWSKTKDLANIMLDGKVEDTTEEPTEPAAPTDSTEEPSSPTEPAPTDPITDAEGDSAESSTGKTDNIFIRLLLMIWNFVQKLFGIY